MRRIKTQADIDKARRRNNLILGSVMILLLVFATAGYSLMSAGGDDKKSKVNEGGIDFYKQNGRWLTQIDGVVFGFMYLPSEVSNVDVNISANLGQYVGQTLYFAPENENSLQIENNIGKYALKTQGGCLENRTCEEDVPIIGCDKNLIIFDSGNLTKVYQEENCVFIVGDALKATDAFLYKLLQII